MGPTKKEQYQKEQRLLPRAFRDVHHAATLSRTLFQRSVAWALLSEQWLDVLAR